MDRPRRSGAAPDDLVRERLGKRLAQVDTEFRHRPGDERLDDLRGV